MEFAEKRGELLVVVSDLIQINRDRLDGYTKSSARIKKNPGLKQMLDQRAADSEAYLVALEQYLKESYDITPNDVGQGWIFRGWMDIKSACDPETTPTILDCCESRDESALKAYDLALRSESELDEELQTLLTKQKEGIQVSYDELKVLSQHLDKINI